MGGRERLLANPSGSLGMYLLHDVTHGRGTGAKESREAARRCFGRIEGEEEGLDRHWERAG